MNIIQQILSLSTDFFNTNMESLVTGQASLTDVTLAVQEFVQNLGREVLSAMLEQADEAIYETVKPQRTYQIKETARPRTLPRLEKSPFTAGITDRKTRAATPICWTNGASYRRTAGSRLPVRPGWQIMPRI